MPQKKFESEILFENASLEEVIEKIEDLGNSRFLRTPQMGTIAKAWNNAVEAFKTDTEFKNAYSNSHWLAQMNGELYSQVSDEEQKKRDETWPLTGKAVKDFDINADNLDYLKFVHCAVNAYRSISNAKPLEDTPENLFEKLLKEKLAIEIEKDFGDYEAHKNLTTYATGMNEVLAGEEMDLLMHVTDHPQDFHIQEHYRLTPEGKLSIAYQSQNELDLFQENTNKALVASGVPLTSSEIEVINQLGSKAGYKLKKTPYGTEDGRIGAFKPIHAREDGSWIVELKAPVEPKTTGNWFKKSTSSGSQGVLTILTPLHLAGRKPVKGEIMEGFVTGIPERKTTSSLTINTNKISDGELSHSPTSVTPPNVLDLTEGVTHQLTFDQLLAIDQELEQHQLKNKSSNESLSTKSTSGTSIASSISKAFSWGSSLTRSNSSSASSTDHSTASTSVTSSANTSVEDLPSQISGVTFSEEKIKEAVENAYAYGYGGGHNPDSNAFKKTVKQLTEQTFKSEGHLNSEAARVLKENLPLRTWDPKEAKIINKAMEEANNTNTKKKSKGPTIS